MAKSEAPLPTAAMQASSTSGARYSHHSSAYETLTEIDEDARGALSEAEQSASQKTLLKGIFQEYYKRGVNILKPEIVLTSEFVPIRKTFETDQNTGLSVDFGNGEFGVTGVLKLLELHQVVTQIVNESSKNFISATVQGIDPSEILEEIKGLYDESILGANLSETVDNFLEVLSSDIASQLQASREATSVLYNQAAAASSGFIEEDSSSDTQADPVFVSFRDILTSSEQDQKEMIRALVEVVIIEKIMFSVGSYFKDLVLLRKKIAELISIPNMTTGDSGVTSYLDTKLKDIFLGINKYKYIASTQDGAGISILRETQNFNGAEIVDSYSDSYYHSGHGAAKASNYLAGEDIAKYGLNTASISSADSNLLVLYQLFYRILSLLDPAYCNQSPLWPDGTDGLDELTDRARISFAHTERAQDPESTSLSSESNIASYKMTDFFKRIGLSSFWTGNLLKRRGGIASSRSTEGVEVGDHIYTSIPHCNRDDLKNHIYVHRPGQYISSTALESTLFGSRAGASLTDRSTYTGADGAQGLDVENFNDVGLGRYLDHNSAGPENDGGDDNLENNYSYGSYNFLRAENNPRSDGYTGAYTVDMSNDVSGYSGVYHTGGASGNPRSSMLTPGVSPYDNMRLTAGEFLGISCFDIVLDLNRRSGAHTTEAGPTIGSTSSGLRNYFRAMLGDHGVPDIHNEAGRNDVSLGAYHQASVHQFYKIVNPEGYEGAGRTELRKGYAHTGYFHDVIFADYPVIEDSSEPTSPGDVAMLPSEVVFIDTAHKHLPGNIGIISEAFVNDNFTQLDKYISDLSCLVGKFSDDILNYTSLGQTDLPATSDDILGAAGSQNPSPSWWARSIMKALGTGIKSQYNKTSGEWSDVISQFAPVLNEGREAADEIFDLLLGGEAAEALGVDFTGTLGQILDDIIDTAAQPIKAYMDFQESTDTSRYILPLLFLTAAGEDDSTASHNILCGLVGNIHYNHMLHYRGQRDLKGSHGSNDLGHSEYNNREWFQFGAFDNLNKILKFFGESKFGGEPTENDEYYNWLGQYPDYVGNQVYDDKGTACFPPTLIKGKKVLLGPDSTADLFEAVEGEMPSFIKGRNQLHISYVEMNDTITDVFMGQGLNSDGGIDIVDEGDSDGVGDVINEPVLYMKKKIHVTQPSYALARGIWGSDFERMIGKFDGISADSGHVDDFNRYRSHYYVPFSETHAKTDGPYETNETARDFATINAISQVLGASLNVRVEGDDYGMKIAVLPHQMQAITDVLVGIAKRGSPALASATSDCIFMRASVFTDTGSTLIDSDHALQEYMSLEDGNESNGYQLYSLTYDNCTAALSDIMKPVYDKENSIRICLAAIIKHISNLNRAKEEIVSITDSSNRDPLTALGLDFANQISSETTETGESLEDIKVQLLRYMTQTSLPTYYKNVFELVCESDSSALYPSSEAMSANQLRMMSIALTDLRDYGLAEDEKMGKKSIVNVGIPSNLIDYLQYQGFQDLGSQGSASDIYDSPYVCVQLYKKDTLGGKLLYYPKLFLFNADIFIVENYKNPDSGALYGLAPVAQLVDAAEISSFEELYDKFEMCKVDYNSTVNHITKVSGDSGMLSRADDLEYLDDANEFITGGDTGQGLQSIAQREMKINHMLDYYLKIYLKLATGIDTNEYVFPLKNSAAIRQNLHTGRDVGPERTRRHALRQRLQNQLILNYPSANVDPVLAAELFRMDKNIAKANIFTSYEKCKNLISPKAFSRVFTMLVNESDFVVYPYPLKWQGGLSENNLIESLQDLYDPSPKFSLSSERQLSGISNTGKAQIVYSNVVSNVLSGLAGNFIESDAWKDMSSDTLAMIRHMDDVEGDGVSDVYELFATVSLIKRK